MPGPPPTPTSILENRGSWRAKERASEPRLPNKAPSCPAWLPKEAKAEWNRQVKQLKKMGVMAEPDRAILASYCLAWAEVCELTEDLETAPADDRWRVRIARHKAIEALVKIGQQFGFTPSSRARVNAPPTTEEKHGPSLRDFKLA